MEISNNKDISSFINLGINLFKIIDKNVGGIL